MAAIKMIAPWQRSRIFGLAKELGISTKSEDRSDDLHLLLHSRIGKDSLTALSFDEANSIIGELNHRQRFGESPAPLRPKFQFTEKPGGMSYGQYRKVLALMCELRKHDLVPSEATIEQRVAGIIKKYLHMTVSPDNPYSWLSCKQSVTLIRCIEGILKSERQKAEARRESG